MSGTLNLAATRGATWSFNLDIKDQTGAASTIFENAHIAYMEILDKRASTSQSVFPPSCFTCTGLVKASGLLGSDNKGAGNQISFEAVEAGEAGNSITVQYIDPGGSHALELYMPNATTINVILAHDGNAVTTRPADIKALLDTDPTAAALVATTVISDVTPAICAAGAITLTGGCDGGRIVANISPDFTRQAFNAAEQYYRLSITTSNDVDTITSNGSYQDIDISIDENFTGRTELNFTVATTDDDLVDSLAGGDLVIIEDPANFIYNAIKRIYSNLAIKNDMIVKLDGKLKGDDQDGNDTMILYHIKNATPILEGALKIGLGGGT